MKINKFVILIAALLIFEGSSYAQTGLGGLPGAFSRLGFSARGIAMGNAMTSVITGDIVGYYNPAVSAFQDDHLISFGHSFLSLDRSLNFVSYTKNFKLPKQKDGGAGITFSWINAGVTNIDSRDGDGFPLGSISTSENQFLFAPSIRVSKDVALGVGFKLYYSKLYDGVKSTSLGFDLGGIIKPSDRINIGFAVKDINSKYQWNTTSIYNENGSTTINKFPVLLDVGVSYLLPKSFGIVSLDFENSSQTVTIDGTDYKTASDIIRMGAEVSPIRDLKLRAGFDRFDLKSNDKLGNAKINFGVGYQVALKSYIVGIDYAFVMEPYSNNPFQTLTAVFKIK
jgi:hypothetical protein